MIFGYARKLQHCMCAGRQSESCRLRAQALLGAGGVSEDTDLRVGLFVCACSGYRRACVCMYVHVCVCLHAWAHQSMYVCA